jgi:hypothetical protein
MNEEDFQQFVALFKQIDPDGFQLFEILAMLRKHGHGKIEVEVINGVITKIHQTLGFKLR